MTKMEDKPGSSVNNSEENIIEKVIKKPSKRGIIYLSTIPPYMNVSKIREVLSQFGKVGRVYLQLGQKDHKITEQTEKSKKRKVARKFTEGWVEFEKKVVAKRVASLLNNTQVSARKKSKQYDCLWNIKYLSGFKWTHLHERLNYERVARLKRSKEETQKTKQKANFFQANIKKKKNKEAVNKEFENLDEQLEEKIGAGESSSTSDRRKFLPELFS